MRNDCLVCKTRVIGNGMHHQWRQQWLRDRTITCQQICRASKGKSVASRLCLRCSLPRSASRSLVPWFAQLHLASRLNASSQLLPPLLYSGAASTIDKPGCSLLRQAMLCPQQLVEVHFVPAAALRMGSFEHGQTSLWRQAVLCPQQLVEVHFVPVVAVCQLHLHARLRRPVRLQK